MIESIGFKQETVKFWSKQNKTKQQAYILLHLNIIIQTQTRIQAKNNNTHTHTFEIRNARTKFSHCAFPENVRFGIRTKLLIIINTFILLRINFIFGNYFYRPNRNCRAMNKNELIKYFSLVRKCIMKKKKKNKIWKRDQKTGVTSDKK